MRTTGSKNHLYRNNEPGEKLENKPIRPYGFTFLDTYESTREIRVHYENCPQVYESFYQFNTCLSEIPGSAR